MARSGHFWRFFLPANHAKERAGGSAPILGAFPGILPGKVVRQVVRQDAGPCTLEACAPWRDGLRAIPPGSMGMNEIPGSGRGMAGEIRETKGADFHQPDEAPRPYGEAWPIAMDIAYWSFSVVLVFARVWQ